MQTIADSPSSSAQGHWNCESPAWCDLYAHAQHIGRKVLQNTPATCELHRTFRRLAVELHVNATASELRCAIMQFNSLPAAQRARIMNGWQLTPDYEQPSQEWLGRTPHLFIIAGNPIAGVDFLCRDTVEPVVLAIELGTSRRVVLKAIDALRARVASGWQQLVTDPMDLRADESDAAARLLRTERR